MKKVVKSPVYNYVFDDEDGFFARWGKTKEDDPIMSPFGPEIADIEISTVCNGIGTNMATRRPCPWCYKSNTGCGYNMSFETFKTVFHKLPKNLTQIAFGIGDIDGNPDLWRIMDYCRNNDYNKVVPNITTNGMGVTESIAKQLANTCGAVSVSRYHLPNVCYDAIQKLSDAGLKQVNIHQLLADETYDGCFKLLDDTKNDPRLAGLNAIVFLMLKPKGARNKYHNIENTDKFNKLIKHAQDVGVKVGMDSCTAPLMFKFSEVYNQQEIVPSIEPCESFGLFSCYINTFGVFFPCSFAEGEGEWTEGIDVVNCDSFMKDVWFSDKLNKWRYLSLNSTRNCDCKMKKYCRSCPIFDITPCKK